jgi:hypothetical protein
VAAQQVLCGWNFQPFADNEATEAELAEATRGQHYLLWRAAAVLCSTYRPPAYQCILHSMKHTKQNWLQNHNEIQLKIQHETSDRKNFHWANQLLFSFIQ